MKHWAELIPTDRRELEMMGEFLAKDYWELMKLEERMKSLRASIRKREADVLIRCHSNGMSVMEINEYRNNWIAFEYPIVKAMHPDAAFIDTMHESALPIYPSIKDDLPPGASAPK